MYSARRSAHGQFVVTFYEPIAKRRMAGMVMKKNADVRPAEAGDGPVGRLFTPRMNLLKTQGIRLLISSSLTKIRLCHAAKAARAMSFQKFAQSRAAPYTEGEEVSRKFPARAAHDR